MNSKYWVAPLAVLALAACSDRNADTAAVENNAADTMAMDHDNMAMPAAVAAPLPANAQEFADTVAASDNFEIESAKLAGGKTADPKLKEFAAMLVTQHTQSTADLKAAAGTLSPPVTPNPALTPALQANLDGLKLAEGSDFDRLYVGQQIAAHEKALALLQGYSTDGDVAPFKEFAAKTAPVVQQHLEMARSMQK